jgi:hypothetical protein
MVGFDEVSEFMDDHVVNDEHRRLDNPWTVIPVSDRNAYVNALEKASVGENIAPFAEFLAGLVKKRLAGEPLPAVPKASS